ncbi:hypothetical protein L1987_71269 [Smallanthus sonchifolius]|uniref:Uncharacterized protein n=1 Tax=Smallanthus sonchifolius TaxID=185202 RepID=A0ACB9ATB3_9ASTR|nr:hypothetical protein L1987_71269 [Smallanthus sonchifolius]
MLSLSLRYQNFGDYYNDPTIIEDVGQTALGICSNESVSEPTFSNQFVEEFLTDIRVVTPKTSNFYVSSTRRSSSGNVTLYAISQCIENTTERICQNCLNTAYNNLYGCYPHTEGRATDLGCFMRKFKQLSHNCCSNCWCCPFVAYPSYVFVVSSTKKVQGRNRR